MFRLPLVHNQPAIVRLSVIMERKNRMGTGKEGGHGTFPTFVISQLEGGKTSQTGIRSGSNEPQNDDRERG